MPEITEARLRPQLADLVLAGGVALVALWQVAGTGFSSGSVLLISLLMILAVGTYRLVPGLALGLAWAASGLQVVAGLEVLVVQLATIVVAYGTARYGSRVVVWASGLSIPVGAGIVLLYVVSYGRASLMDLGTRLLPAPITNLATAFLLVLLVLSAPWGLGLVLRLRAQFRLARAEREQAEVDAARAREIADVRAEQARLARDVHDVVGHSLTVILAQADSVEFMADDDIDRIRAALTNISKSARRSLGDVRQVLSSTSDPSEPASAVAGGLESLLDGVSSAGNDVRSQVHGTARPLPPELDVVAFRVLQEMLTNALKHGRRGAPIEVDRAWLPDDLRIEVRNIVAVGTDPESTDGIGQAGMRRRLEAVGGRLEVRHDVVGDRDQVFVATAWVPLRPRGGHR